jgi:fibro-slime domain-containing protein
MKRVFFAVALAATAVSAAPARAALLCHSLLGTIWDQSAEHPNFEEALSGLETGIVLPILGADGTPDFNPATTATSVTNATDFYDWYHDTPANMSVPYIIDLLETSPGVYSFSSSEFYPIDDQLLGNEGNSHNYHFTMQMFMPFEYQPGQYIDVSSDDDLWIFIDDQLALDLGGLHSNTGGSIDLDTLGLVPGEAYMIDLFYAERHTTEAQFHMETNVLCAVVPEPSTFALGGLASLGAGLCWLRRRK